MNDQLIILQVCGVAFRSSVVEAVPFFFRSTFFREVFIDEDVGSLQALGSPENVLLVFEPEHFHHYRSGPSIGEESAIPMVPLHLHEFRVQKSQPGAL